jgi:signal transduction histidine kinase
MSRGIHPAILSEGGLGPVLKALTRRSAVPVELEVGVQARLPERVEVAAYFVVSEALANAAKHAQASVVRVHVQLHDSTLEVMIRDDGTGGADPSRGSGLIGLTDRVEALGGTIHVFSPVGAGTQIMAELPVNGSLLEERGGIGDGGRQSRTPGFRPCSVTTVSVGLLWSEASAVSAGWQSRPWNPARGHHCTSG